MVRRKFVLIVISLRKIWGKLGREFLYYALRSVRLSHNRVIFSVFMGERYGGNPKYIAEEILRRNLNCDLVWLLTKENMANHNLPSQIRPVRSDSLRAIYELVTAGVWVDNHLKPVYVKKRKGQCYIQTTHGFPCLKRLEFGDYIEWNKIEAKKIDVYLSNGAWTSSVIMNDLWYKGEILECGAPRNDIFFNADPSISQRIRGQYSIKPEQKVVLYAPTWRTNKDLSSYTLDVDACFAALRQRFPGDWVLMTRLHPAIPNRSFIISGTERMVDASQHEDVQELLVTVDVVITDYSSLMFDFAIRRLPVFLYTPDLDSYREERGFYFNEDELPFSFAQNNGQLSSMITAFDERSYIRRVDEFFEGIGSCDNGTASEAVVNRVEAHLRRSKAKSNSYHSGITT